jgi:DNA polymerase-4
VNWICRGCGAMGAGANCACGDARRLAHPELADLTIAHLDCDAFYATIEKRDDPSLAAKPVIVGGGRRGVVSTCCYLARAFGVRSAMPMFKALKLCPHAVVVRPDIDKYAAVGRQVRAMMEALTPKVQPLSIDEAFMDLSGLEALHRATPAQMLVRLQARIEAELGVTASVGLSYNKLLAKMASDLDKPRGFALIGRADAVTFLASRPVQSLPGVGPAGAKALAAAGYPTVGAIAAASAAQLKARFGEWGLKLLAMSRGEDSRIVDPDAERKTISAETTFHVDIASREALEDIVWDLADQVAARARSAGLSGRTITLKLRDASFRTLTRRRQSSEPTRLAARVFETSRAMLSEAIEPGRAYRLVGVGLSDFEAWDEADKGDLVDAEAPRRAAVEDAVAAVRARFGKTAVAGGRSLRRRAARAGRDREPD